MYSLSAKATLHKAAFVLTFNVQCNSGVLSLTNVLIRVSNISPRFIESLFSKSFGGLILSV